MTDFEGAWRAWTSYHRSNGFEIERFLNGPADPAALDGLERAIGFRLPDDLRALWSTADGQMDVFEIEDPAPGTVLSPVFGSYYLISAEQALEQYRLLRDIAEEYPDRDAYITVRGDDPVHCRSWHPGWLPISEDGGGNCYAVDLSPAEGGTYGQVILFGRNEDERRVLAPSITAWLAEAAERKPPLNDEAEPPIAYFDMMPD